MVLSGQFGVPNVYGLAYLFPSSGKLSVRIHENVFYAVGMRFFFFVQNP